MSAIFCISDLHMGDGGPRDNFSHMDGGNRSLQLNRFLDYVEAEHGRLYIIGDLFELWQSSVSAVITHRIPLLDRLARMGATYMLGNHDIDLRHFASPSRIGLTHPLLVRMPMQCVLGIGGKQILLIHGHEQDPYCNGEVPGIGRISAIYTGMKEDRNGSPIIGRKTVEAATFARLGVFSELKRILLCRRSYTLVMRDNMKELLEENAAYDAIVYGHTHEPGQFEGLPIYNSGTWADKTNTFVRIEEDGTIGVWDWVEGKPQPNLTVLSLSQE